VSQHETEYELVHAPDFERLMLMRIVGMADQIKRQHGIKCFECEHYNLSGHCRKWDSIVPVANRVDGCDEWSDFVPF
jgi:lipopolysaccharide biosynthesis regulator YciM